MKTIQLTRGMVATVDDCDYPFLANKKWCARPSRDGRRWYAMRNRHSGSPRPKIVLMHREILDPDDGVDVDHRDFDGLNNRRSNLRCGTRSNNMSNLKMRPNNTSGFKGVSYSSDRNKWEAKIKRRFKTVHLGRFNSAEQAALAYDKAAIEMHGEFALTNKRLGLI